MNRRRDACAKQQSNKHALENGFHDSRLNCRNSHPIQLDYSGWYQSTASCAWDFADDKFLFKWQTATRVATLIAPENKAKLLLSLERQTPAGLASRGQVAGRWLQWGPDLPPGLCRLGRIRARCPSTIGPSARRSTALLDSGKTGAAIKPPRIMNAQR